MNSILQSRSATMHRRNKVWRKFRYWLRRRSLGTKLDLTVVIIAIILAIVTYVALTASSPISDNPDHIIWLLNFDLLAMLALLGIVARRIFTLWSSRKKKAAGSRLHIQLVMTFGFLAAFPAIIMTIFSAGFFYFGIHSWFSDRVQGSIERSASVAQAYLEEHQSVIKADATAMAADLARNGPLLLNNLEGLERFIKTQSFLRNLPEVVIFSNETGAYAKTSAAQDIDASTIFNSYSSDLINLDAALIKDTNNQNVRALVPVTSLDNIYLIVGRPIDEEVLSYVAETQDAVEQYTALQLRSTDFQLSVTLIFITLAVLLVLIAVWAGLLIARRIVQPIATLVTATEQVSKGDFNVHIEEETSKNIEEFKALGSSFNTMTEELSRQRRALISANRNIDDRRRFIETILEGVSAGIMSINHKRKITLINNNALNFLGITREEGIDRAVSDLLPNMDELIENALAEPNKIIQSELIYPLKSGEKKTLLVRIASSVSGDKDTGAVITFDDITDLEAAQRKAAWGDVARRIAHEIKNPLTPIQLATERIKRRFGDDIDEAEKEIFDNCTNTILRHVGDIQNMVNAFSAFAKMPKPNLQTTNLIKLAREVYVFQKEAYPHITFTFETDEDTVIRDVDPSLMHQVLVNLVKNAEEALEHTKNPHIYIGLKAKEGHVLIIVANNGPALDNDLKDRITEPYITNKEKGSGLGLAIVKRIIEDHNGEFVIRNIADSDIEINEIETGVVSMIQLP